MDLTVRYNHGGYCRRFFIDKPGSSSTRQSPFYTVRHPKGYRHLALQ